MTDVRYVEFAPAPDLAEYVQSIWYRRVSPEEAGEPARVVPDGCMDVIWIEGEIIVAGPDTKARTSRSASGDEIVGMRFHPGAAPSLLGLPASELVNRRAPLTHISRSWADDLDRRLANTRAAPEIGKQLESSLRGRLNAAMEIDKATQHVAMMLRSFPEHARVDRLAESVGLSERQLNRRCQDAFGYGAKLLARIIRFQRFLDIADTNDGRALAHLAAECGYADQAHLSREVKELSGLSPRQLLSERGQSS